jgi:hypothetical protein
MSLPLFLTYCSQKEKEEIQDKKVEAPPKIELTKKERKQRKPRKPRTKKVPKQVLPPNDESDSEDDILHWIERETEDDGRISNLPKGKKPSKSKSSKSKTPKFLQEEDEEDSE